MSERFDAFGSSRDAEPTTMSAFVPLLVLALVLLAWFCFQATLLHAERDALRDALADPAQVKRGADAKKLLASLDAIARGTDRLANAGNPNARLIVDELKKHGITIATTEPVPAAESKKP